MANNTPKKEMDLEMVRSIATLSATGKTVRELASEFKLSTFMVMRALKSDVGKEVKAAIVSGAVEASVAQLKSGVSDLVPEVIRVLKDSLEKDNLYAVQLVFKVLGLEQQAAPQQGAQTLQVILPGAYPKQEKEIEVREDVIDLSEESGI